MHNKKHLKYILSNTHLIFDLQPIRYFTIPGLVLIHRFVFKENNFRHDICYEICTSFYD